MRNRGRVSLSITIVIVLLLAPLLFSIPVAASPFTVVTVSLQEDPPSVDVSPGSSGIVTMAGEVTCVKWGPDQVKVFLEATSETGGTSVVPNSFVFSGSGGSEHTETFSVTTKIPMGYSSSANPSITVGGYYDQGGLRTSIAPVTQIIIVMQYYKIGVFTEDTLVQAESGENANIDFNIINEGNGDDIFLVDLENRGTLESKGFKLPTSMEVPIDENGSKNINYDVGISKDISGTHNLNLIITSQGSERSGGNIKYKMTITLDISPKSQGDSGDGENPGAIVPDEVMGIPFYLILILLIIVLFLVILILVMKRTGDGTIRTITLNCIGHIFHI
jgi:hypothetical protein